MKQTLKPNSKLAVFLNESAKDLSLEDLNTLSQIIHVLTEEKLSNLVLEYNLNKTPRKN